MPREAVSSPQSVGTVTGATARRKHRPGLQRVSIACERCRTRKNKCDRKLPECSTCKAAGATCVVVDRLTNRQYPRGHVEGLELEVERLKARIQELEIRSSEANPSTQGSRPSTESVLATHSTPLSFNSTDAHEPSSITGITNDDFTAIPRDVTRSGRFIGDSSGLFFGTIVKGILLQADYKGEHGPATSSLRLRLAERQTTSTDAQFSFPDDDLANRLQTAYFTSRWPALPFLHRGSFLEQHFEPCLALKFQASEISLFMSFMVLALGAIDVKRQDSEFGDDHVQFFRYATENYLHSLLEEDSIQTVQGLLLISQFAINEHQSANAWLVTGQAIRTAIDLGLHRTLASLSSELGLFDLEMRKRVFWSAYAIDRNVSITLGRPCGMRDEDIDVPLPQNLSDDDLVANFTPTNTIFNQPLDMSTFIHIVKLRQIQSRIQALFYSANPASLLTQGISYHQTELRSQLEDWIAQAPRYSRPTMATFQSQDWFQIAYSHALLLLYRPSPGNPIIDSAALQLCADAAISLISSYSSLYAKNKITYTWIALHSLFMASITMLYTLSVSPEIRASTTKAVVKSNVVSCLALFEVMADYWPLATRCHNIIERVGNHTVTLFDTAQSSARDGGPTASETLHDTTQQHFGQIDAEFMEWFGTRDNYAPLSFSDQETSSHHSGTASNLRPHNPHAHGQSFPNPLDISLENIDDIFSADFDNSIPMMITAFGNESHLPIPTPRPSEVSDTTMSSLPNI
ncbi:hypothetical protein BU24DRAFT_465561 [Aaosphaeria arxii CBS 175.79]|uniref:Zn(2)-C6 fungal-type domain-containing protein n=1 Tax=Aaosphaeria arxii CBS 175.79 TaxID=1450172 RepID=A0A6A5XFF8_9PLEO|nr:uncharacterized protein BU24DRAFT_465561 [Aaosphaeria arxii CBS 175.79]KAF2011985.1 hypothetical protein BU24DRAFT_465561 [Aaosphaeria arxii CBS 175.79]